MKTYAIIVAAGNSSRMKSNSSKQFIMLDKMPLLAYTLKAFSDSDVIDEIIIVTRSHDILKVRDMALEFSISKVTAIIPGGNTRQESVALGLLQVENPSYVLIHDGARPFITPSKIAEVCSELCKNDAVTLGVPVKDTIKIVDDNGIIIETLNRDRLMQIQTPQGFKAEIIKEAHLRAEKSGIVTTDDCSLVAEEMKIPTKVILGDYNNIKITTQEDLDIARGILKI
ncbi:MAG: 2-C-methyl-D-erythritol 4-phosphate cytidylyltransferase [Oscillospiraceae bacterium]